MPMGKFTIYNLQFTIKIILLLFSLYIVHCTFYITPAHADWTLDLNPPTTTCSVGCASNTYSSNTDITILCSESPNCQSVTYSRDGGANTTTNGSSVTINTLTSSSISAFSTDNAGNISSSIALTVISAPSFDFSLSNSGNITITPGQNGSNTITVTLQSGTTQSVTSTPPAGPGGSIISLSNNPCTPSCSQSLMITNTGSILPGTYLITVSGSPSDPKPANNSTSFNLIVNAIPNNPPTCSSINGPASLTVGQAGSYTVTASDSDGFISSYLWSSAPAGGTFSSTTAASPTWSASSVNIYNINAIVTDNSGASVACPQKSVNVNSPAWIQTQDGDVHSNTRI